VQRGSTGGKQKEGRVVKKGLRSEKTNERETQKT